MIKSDNTFSKDHYIKNNSELLFDNSMEKENITTRKTLDLNPTNIQSKEKAKAKNKEELNENAHTKKSSFNKAAKSNEKKILEDEDMINDSNLKDITVMMKKILDDI